MNRFTAVFTGSPARAAFCFATAFVQIYSKGRSRVQRGSRARTASTGPSKTTHILLWVWSRAARRKVMARMPSDHSCDTSSNMPYSLPADTAFGLITKYLVEVPVAFSAAAST
eukprot:1194250-Prorocentrum_minimum.AAC.3